MAEPVRIQATGGGVRLRLRVKPGGRRGVLLGAYGGALKLEVSAPPEHGRANAAVIRLLADTFGVTPSDVSLVSGAAGRNKVVEVLGCSSEKAVSRLRAAGIEAEVGENSKLKIEN